MPSERPFEAGDLPGRRYFLSAGAATLLGVLVLPACTGDSRTPASRGPGVSVPSGAGAAVAAGDLALGRTMASLEALTVAVYDSALNAAKITTPTFVDAAKLFMDHHRQHLNAVEGVIGVPRDSTQPNQVIRQKMIDPVISDPTLDEIKLLNLAFSLEDAAAQTYVFATTQLTKPDVRSTFMTIGSVEARHRALLGAVALRRATSDLIPSAFFRSDDPLPATALLK